MSGRPVEPLAVGWAAAVFASLVLPPDAGAARPAAVGAAAAVALGWGLAAAVTSGRLAPPARWSAWARRPPSSRTLLVLGAAVGPVLLYFLLGCLRVVAFPPGERRR